MPLICFSGGADSTLLVAVHAMLGIPFRTIAVNHPQVNNSYGPGYAARRAIMDTLRGRGYRWPHLELTIGHRGLPGAKATFAVERSGDIAPRGGLAQPPLWIAATVPYLNSGEDLVLAYIAGDCATRGDQYSDLVAAVDALVRISGFGGRMSCPLIHTDKTQIVRSLRDLGLYTKTWWCEDPAKSRAGTPARCGKCAPCWSHATAAWRLKTGRCATKSARKFMRGLLGQ